MGLLGDLYSTIDSKKRQLRGLLSDPLETLYQGVRNFGAEHQALLDMQARAYPWTGTDRTAAPDLMARKALADAGAAQGMSSATVWHGSPHKFDKFDSSKIGTGEGAQAYGHGLYLAESPDVAGQYQKTLSADGFLVGDKVFDPSSLQHMNVRSVARKGDIDTAIAEAQKHVASASPVSNLAAQDLAKLQEIKDAGGLHKNTGSMYKVDLPDEHIARMLDWDKPLSQQPKEVQQALGSQQVQAAVSKLKNSGQLGDYSAADLQRLKGEDWYDILRQANGDSNVAPSAFMKQQGIPGIRYLDGGSRGAGQGSSNFVVFPGNEGLLSILERNGAPIK